VAEMEELRDGLPRTLVHGDCKVANFALLAGGGVAAFDFAMLGAAPPAIEVGWYLAVNATRLARPREAFLARYRELLREARGADLDEVAWQLLVRAAVLAGALMLLWSKALAFEGGAERAQAEWRWWVDRLAAMA
jgi:aminoglycoside phosphotransferase (APT) family kinase protein